MTEEIAAPEAAGAAQTAETGGAATDTGAAPSPASAPATLAEGTPPPETAPVEPDWPDDWRDRFVKKAKAEERDKLQKRLNRFASPDNVLSSYLELERKLASGALKGTLPENPTEDDVAAYHKAWNVPETPEGYAVTLPQGVEMSEVDKADLNAFLADMHGAHAPAPIVQKAVERFFAMREQAEQQLYEAAHELTINHRAEVKAEFGRDFDRNVKLAKADLASVLSAEKAEGLVSLTLNDGTKLGDHPDFIRYAVSSALRQADETALVTSDVQTAGKTLEDAYNEALDLRFSDPDKYHTDTHQEYLNRLAAAKARQRAA